MLSFRSTAVGLLRSYIVRKNQKQSNTRKTPDITAQYPVEMKKTKKRLRKQKNPPQKFLSHLLQFITLSFLITYFVS